MSATETDTFAWIIRTLVHCRQEADRLRLPDLSQIINMAVLQTALDWEGVEPSRTGDSGLESLLRLKMKLAYSERKDNVVILSSESAAEM